MSYSQLLVLTLLYLIVALQCKKTVLESLSSSCTPVNLLIATTNTSRLNLHWLSAVCRLAQNHLTHTWLDSGWFCFWSTRPLVLLLLCPCDQIIWHRQLTEEKTHFGLWVFHSTSRVFQSFTAGQAWQRDSTWGNGGMKLWWGVAVHILEDRKQRAQALGFKSLPL